MAQISGRKLRGTPSEPIVNLGGEFSRLAEEEGTHKAQLARVHAELAVHKEALAHERQQHAASRETVAQLREHSADLEATIRTLLGVLDDVGPSLDRSQVSARPVHTERCERARECGGARQHVPSCESFEGACACLGHEHRRGRGHASVRT